MSPITKMRIHSFGGKEVLQADDIEPSLPDAGQVLVAVHAASINPVDFKIRSGKYPAVKDDRWEVGRHAREIDPEFPVVYMSGDSADAWASKGVPNSIMLAKPFAPAQLVTAVSQLLNSGMPTA